MAESTEWKRPIHLYDAKENAYVRHRYYANKLKAFMAGYYECRASPVGTVIEIVDVEKGKAWGSYRLKANGDVHCEGGAELFIKTAVGKEIVDEKTS